MRIVLLVSTDLPWALQLASLWAAQGDHVTVVLFDAAATAAREGHHHAEAVSKAMTAGAIVVAHTDALRRRAIGPERRIGGVKTMDLDEVADLITEGADHVISL
ncbi:MAG: DsrE family protein [Egibacteraceae bacterium]